MIFEPKTEQELQTMSLLTDGVYKYRVVSADEKVSQKGNSYIALKLEIIDKESGELRYVYTNLSLMYLLKHFCDVNNMQAQYTSGSLAARECLGKFGGEVVIAIDPEKPNSMGGVYKAKNIVKDYIDMKGSALHPQLNSNSNVNTHSSVPMVEEFDLNQVPF